MTKRLLELLQTDTEEGAYQGIEHVSENEGEVGGAQDKQCSHCAKQYSANRPPFTRVIAVVYSQTENNEIGSCID